MHPYNTQVSVRYFNTEGPIEPQEHYCIPPLERVDLDEIEAFIRWKKYFLLHAPRQSGKTSTLEALAQRLNASGDYRCLNVNIQTSRTAADDLAEAIEIILSRIVAAARRTVGVGSLRALWDQVSKQQPAGSALEEFLELWCVSEPKPVVLLLDEIDSLSDLVLLSVVDQLRSGHPLRPVRFPQSVVLCGQRNVRDYRIRTLRGEPYPARASPFNIVAESLRLGDFSLQEVEALLAQHTLETGQEFEPKAVERVWELTLGQPWLVNALCFQACFKSTAGRDRSRPIPAGAVEAAKETLILKRVTHLDQLAAKLREGPVRRVIEPLLAGTDIPVGVSEDDIDYVCDLGLVRADGAVEIANPIYREVVPRQLASTLERYIHQRKQWYVGPGHRLETERLMEAFQSWYRESSEHWLPEVEYKEAGPQLLLQSFLQRVVNRGGRIEREYALGRGRTDLLIRWPRREGGDPSQGERHVVECKVLRPGRGLEGTVRTALEQTARYMDHCGTVSGHVVIFDRRPGKTWEERIFRRAPEPDARPPITVWGM